MNLKEAGWQLTSSGSDNPPLLIDGLEELPNNERDRLDTLHFLLCAQKLATKVLRFITNVLL